jgi:predicted ester cyclase
VSDERSTNRRTLDEHIAAEKRHDPDAAAATYVEDSFYENVALGLRFDGQPMVAMQYGMTWAFIPDMAADYAWELELDDVIVQAGTLSGTAGDSMLGVPGTGGPVSFGFTTAISFRDGKMLGEHVWYDLDDLCRQVGVDVDAVRAAAADLRTGLTTTPA